MQTGDDQFCEQYPDDRNRWALFFELIVASVGPGALASFWRWN
jgi:hypothetical protein